MGEGGVVLGVEVRYTVESFVKLNKYPVAYFK